MKRKLLSLLLVLALLFVMLSGCGANEVLDTVSTVLDIVEVLDSAAEETAAPTPAPSAPAKTPSPTAPPASEPAPAPTSVPEETPIPAEKASVTEDGEYSSPEDVALYIHTFGHLPDNFITKNEAKKLGWDSSKGNLWDVAPGKSIGGDRFGNYEGILPKGSYTECDVNYSGGRRGAERIVFSDKGSIYYTNDHYETFEQLY